MCKPEIKWAANSHRPRAEEGFRLLAVMIHRHSPCRDIVRDRFCTCRCLGPLRCSMSCVARCGLFGRPCVKFLLIRESAQPPSGSPCHSATIRICPRCLHVLAVAAVLLQNLRCSCSSLSSLQSMLVPHWISLVVVPRRCSRFPSALTQTNQSAPITEAFNYNIITLNVLHITLVLTAHNTRINCT